MFQIHHPLRRLLALAMLGALVLLVSACAPSLPRSYVVLLPDADGSVGQVIVSGQKGQQVLTRAGQVAAIDGHELKAELPAPQIDAVFGDARAALPAAPEHVQLYFFSGSTRLTRESETQFSRLVSRLRGPDALPVLAAVVIGHTDTVGSAEDNLVLSAQRAKVVADRLRASGLKFSSLTMESHGKSNPLVPTRDGVDEPRNRRVQITLH